ncbi:MAG: hypothetical protein NVS3B3_09340 [Aquirhabdus sp.]
MSDRKLGLKGPDPDHMRKRFMRLIPPTLSVPLPSEYDYKYLLGPIEDQAHVGACVLFTATTIIEAFLKKHENVHIDISERAAYALTQQYYEQSSLGQDEGTYAADVLAMFRDVGYVLLQDWPNYSTATSDYFVTVPTAIIKKDHRVTNFVRVGGNEDNQNDLLLKMKKALFKHGPLAVGMPWPDDSRWFNLKSDGMLPVPASSAVAGGHEIVYAGWNDPRQSWLVRNHWSENWGDKGYAWLPYNVQPMFMPSDVYTIEVV